MAKEKIFATIGYLPNLEQIATTVFEGAAESALLIQEIGKLALAAKELVPAVQSCLLKDMAEN